MNNNIKLNILKTANGFYVEYESNGDIMGYSVIGKNWTDINPKKHGIESAPFEVGKNFDTSELEALKEQVDKFTKLKELAGDVDIAEAIEAFKTKLAETSAGDSSENNGNSKSDDDSSNEGKRSFFRR
ncbi:MAG: hypothetical protein CR988_02370 [Treponema sp.]|nr:MAG: hypothetical protein CR988_02370 [Treponema sp.]